MEQYIKLLQAIVEDRAKNSDLSISERLKQRREDGVENLLEYGYISLDEAEQYRAQLTELPTDRKGLVIAYFLLGYYTDDSQNLGETTALQRFIRKFRLPERGFGKGDKSIADILSEEELQEFRSGLRRLRTDSELQRAETFVDSKRKRIREALLRPVRARAAYALSMAPETKEELDSNPYLRDVAISNGYRSKAKTINETDRQAIETASRYYLDLLELALLNGEAQRRIEEVYPKYLSEDKSMYSETLIYEDELDEVITEMKDLYTMLDTALCNYYNEESSKSMIGFLKECFSRLYTYTGGEFKETDKKEEDIVLGRVLNTKFRYLIDEGLC